MKVINSSKIENIVEKMKDDLTGNENIPKKKIRKIMEEHVDNE